MPETKMSSAPVVSLDYPFRWQGLEAFQYDLDDERIPRVFISKQAGLQYYPITIAQFGLFQLQEHARTGDEEHLGIAKNNARWLLDNAGQGAHAARVWVHPYDLPFYGPKAPWISGMAQAQAISLLLRMKEFLTDERLEEVIHGAVKVFEHTVADGGVLAYFPDGGVCFEEYPTDPPSMVLNGHMFAMLGLFEYAEFYRDAAVRERFRLAVEGLRQNLQLYDTGFWNLYDLHPSKRLASAMYIKVHAQLLNILADAAGELYFRQTAERWLNYLDRFSCRARWLLQKSFEKLRLAL